MTGVIGPRHARSLQFSFGKARLPSCATLYGVCGIRARLGACRTLPRQGMKEARTFLIQGMTGLDALHSLRVHRSAFPYLRTQSSSLWKEPAGPCGLRVSGVAFGLFLRSSYVPLGSPTRPGDQIGRRIGGEGGVQLGEQTGGRAGTRSGHIKEHFP